MGSPVTITPDVQPDQGVTITPDQPASVPGAIPESKISAQPQPTGVMDSIAKWTDNVASDIKHGTDLTGVGTVLKKMGAHGVYSGNPEAVGDFMASLPLGLLRMAKGGAETNQPGQVVQGAKDIVGGAAQAATIPAAFVAPDAGEAASAGVDAAGAGLRTVKNMFPSAMKQNAGEMFASIAQDANKVPVQLENAQDAALRLMDWQKKTQLGPTLNKFLNRVTSGKQGPMTYEEGRDFYSLLTKMSVDETSKMAAPVKYAVKQLVAGLKQDIGDAAEQVGRAADYYKAMGDYAKAARLQEWYDTAKQAAWGGVKYGVPTGLAGYGVKKAIDIATGK